MTQRPSGSPNAGRMNCFPTKTSQPFLSQSQDAFSWLVDTAGIGAGKAGMEVSAVVNVHYWH